MSRLEELIQELCPDGVEYKSLGEIASDIYRGTGIKRNEVTETGIPCVRYGEIYTTYGIWFDQCISHTTLDKVKSPKYFEYGDILFVITGESVEDIAKSTAYVGHEKCIAGGDIVVVKHEQDPKYLSYALATTDARRQKSAGKVKSKVVHSSVPAIAAIQIPIPPLEIQREIVRLLDNFTELIAELTAELTARKKQYAHYRNVMLTFKNEESMNVRLDEIAHFSYGYTDKAGDRGDARFIRITDINDDGCLNPEDAKYITVTDANKKYLLKKGDLLVARTGATYGKTLYVESDAPAVYASFLIKLSLDNNRILNRYYWHFSKSSLYWQQAEKLVSKGGQQQFNANAVGRVIVPVPSLEIQQKIINVLDNFDAICSDLNIGLPAEIEARRKQYEYYRDLLLTFAESGSTVLTDRQTDRQTDRHDIIRLLQHVFGYVELPLAEITHVFR